MSDIVIVTPPVAESAIDLDLVNLTEFLHKSRYPGETYGYGLGGPFGYGIEFENDTFAMFPFYWGDCTCGFDELHASMDVQHSAACFSMNYDREEQRLLATGLSYSQVRDPMIAWAKGHGYPDAPLGMAVHCDCGTKEWWADWSSKHDHTPDCPTVKPNFVHKASGLEIRWYKWIGRDMEIEPGEPTPDEWRAVYAECVASVSS